VWDNDRLVGQSDGTNVMKFLYTDGEIIGFVLNGDSYFYLKNLQGDIVGIVDNTGALVVEYAYDAWGGLISATGALAEVNPFRYRGYYYDLETGLYYCQSRYYNPGWGRWISADHIAYSFTSPDLYGYCLNDPINLTDYTGYDPPINVKFRHVAAGKYTAIERDYVINTYINYALDGEWYNSVEYYLTLTWAHVASRNIAQDAFKRIKVEARKKLAASISVKKTKTTNEKKAFAVMIYKISGTYYTNVVQRKAMTIQACLESAYGTSYYAINNKNLFGFRSDNGPFMKYDSYLASCEGYVTVLNSKKYENAQKAIKAKPNDLKNYITAVGKTYDPYNASYVTTSVGNGSVDAVLLSWKVYVR
jgi:RHS repeat-associated protein